MLLVLVFFIIALGIMAFGLIRKDKIFSYISLALWLLFCIFTYPMSTAAWDIYMDFGVIGTLLAFVSLVVPFTWRGNLGAEEEEVPREYVDDIFYQREQIRGTRNRMTGRNLYEDNDVVGSRIARVNGKSVVVPKIKNRRYSDSTYD